MTFNEVEAFLAIVKHQNFSLAADSLFITQPALSRRLKSLESKTMCVLIERSKGNKKIELTAHGESFLPIAFRWMSVFNDSNNLINGNINQTLIVSALDGIHTCILTNPYKYFVNHMNQHTLKMKILSSKSSYYQVENEMVDLGFIAECQLSQKTVLLPLFQEKMYFISMSNIYSDDIINPETLDIRKCIYAQWNFESDAWFESNFNQNIKPLAIVENMFVLGELLIGNDNWAIVPASIAYYLKKNLDIKIKNLTKPLAERTIYCIYNTKSKKVDLIKEFLEEVNLYINNIPNVKSLLKK